jgi:signal transduction histidine kinase
MNILKPVKNTSEGKTAGSTSPHVSDENRDTLKVSENAGIQRIMELEKLNTRLENLVEQRSNKLTEIVATNSKFISIIAHDLRSPFHTIMGILELIKESLNNENINEIQRYVEIACDSTLRTLTLLDNLLEWAISQNNHNSFNPEKVKLHEIVVEEIESINTSAKQKQITLNHSIAPDLKVTADLHMVKTILRNLIGNAIKYTSSGGKITISAQERKSFVEISVKDSGIGISEEAQRKIFKIDVFQSIVGTNNEKGTGLGLLLCKEFVELHSGNISVESEPGKGSEFKFTLPHYI